jgi:hypothetical protein
MRHSLQLPQDTAHRCDLLFDHLAWLSQCAAQLLEFLPNLRVNDFADLGQKVLMGLCRISQGQMSFAIHACEQIPLCPADPGVSAAEH